MKKLRTIILSIVAICFVAAPGASALSPLTAFAAKCKSGGILNFPSWYDGLECVSAQPQITHLNDFWVVVLNIVGMLIALTSYFAIGYIIWSGFKYIKSQGQANAISEAKMSIIQAIAGLVIALSAFAIIRFIQGAIT